MGQLFHILGLLCVICVIAVSLLMFWYIKKRAADEPAAAEKYILCGAFVRVVFSILAALLLVMSSILQ